MSMSLVQPTVSTLAHLQMVTDVPESLGRKDADSKDTDTDTMALLVDQGASVSADQVGSYTSAPGTLTLATASESILSDSTGESSSGAQSGSLDAENFGLKTKVSGKLLGGMMTFVMVSVVLGTL